MSTFRLSAVLAAALALATGSADAAPQGRIGERDIQGTCWPTVVRFGDPLEIACRIEAKDLGAWTVVRDTSPLLTAVVPPREPTPNFMTYPVERGTCWPREFADGAVSQVGCSIESRPPITGIDWSGNYYSLPR